MMNKKWKNLDGVFTIPAGDTGWRIQGKYDLPKKKKVAVDILPAGLDYRPPEWEWTGALIHLVAKVLDGQVRADKAEIYHALERWLSDNGAREPGPSTVRDMRNKIWAELERVKARDE